MFSESQQSFLTTWTDFSSDSRSKNAPTKSLCKQIRVRQHNFGVRQEALSGVTEGSREGLACRHKALLFSRRNQKSENSLPPRVWRRTKGAYCAVVY